MDEKNEIIQAYFFSKIKYDEPAIIKYLIENDLPTIKTITDNKYYYKIKLLSEKKLKKEGYQIIFKEYKPDIMVNLAYKKVLINNFVEFK